MILIIAEKPSVAQTIAAVLGAKEKKDGFLTGSGYIVSWCVGHLVGLAEAAAYREQYKKWSYDSLPILRSAQRYGIAHLRAISHPDSRLGAKPSEEFIAIEDYRLLCQALLSSA